MKPRVKTGVVGCGTIGNFHLRYASEHPTIELVAVADLRDDEALSAARKYDVPAVYTEGMDLIEDDNVEAVVLAVPTALRFDLALAALKRKKHVLLEKPAAMNTRQLEALMEVKGDCVVASCSSRNRGMVSAQVASEFIASGRLGEIRLLHCRAVAFSSALISPSTPQWRLRKAFNGGGVFANWGSYDLDFLLGICGWKLRPRLVLAQTWMPPKHLPSQTPIETDVESHVAAMICCDDHAVIHYERAESASSSLSSTWQVIGTHGALSLSLVPHCPNRVVFDSVDKTGTPRSETLWEGNEVDDVVHATPIENFASAIIAGEEPLTGLSEALVIQAITDAVYASAEHGCAVEIGDQYRLRTRRQLTADSVDNVTVSTIL